jgi:RNase H-fold protein (predicted Holliday junction resolvase)
MAGDWSEKLTALAAQWDFIDSLHVDEKSAGTADSASATRILASRFHQKSGFDERN